MSRPTKMTPLCVKKLEEAFLMGCTDTEACVYADITRQTLYNYEEKHKGFIDRKETLKQNPFMKARGVILEALEEGDVNTAHKVIDRKEGSKVSVDAKVAVRDATGLSDAELEAIASGSS